MAVSEDGEPDNLPQEVFEAARIDGAGPTCRRR